jgi:hypothetical protein
MNCDLCQELMSDLLDGTLSREDQRQLDTHLEQCRSCAEVRNDLDSILGFCRAHRGEYEAPANERALWLRIRNTLEGENDLVAAKAAPGRSERHAGFWDRLTHRSWQFSFAQLTASVAAIVVVVSLVTVAGLRGIGNLIPKRSTPVERASTPDATRFVLNDRMSQQQQAISMWNARVEMNKARWNPQMRDTFDRNLSVIDQAINDSLRELSKNPHDEVSEEMLNAALNEKLALLKEFSEL